MFLLSYFGKVPKAEILSVIIDFYEEEEIVCAKETLFDTAQQLDVENVLRMKERAKGAQKRRLDCEDIFSLFKIMDKNLVTLPEIYAVKINSLPKMSPSDVDNVRLAESVVSLKKQVSSLTTQLEEVKATMTMLLKASGAHVNNSGSGPSRVKINNDVADNEVIVQLADTDVVDQHAALQQARGLPRLLPLLICFNPLMRIVNGLLCVTIKNL